ncbi:acylphosphatase [Rhizobium sp. BK602]|uniref:acylphosphatase n=1 Tax=Rhizobium sp. BK602 TaxID=2586986 RepID=UPI00160FDD24|nr:acylphosphatase [Rhizobium sp. BK602]MBB3610247.1 acylphosphatase [Rhizobium sp. BK602]
MADDRIAAMVRIEGKVQGVGFRVWTRSEALRLGLAGWVRNNADGSVAALIVGPDAAVSAMLQRLWHGPPGASVSRVERQPVSLAEMPSEFHITG